MKPRVLSYSGKKAQRETSWTSIFILVMVIGQTGLITAPSIASSLLSGVRNYANAAAAYVVISNNQSPSARNDTIPQTTIDQIRTIPGVSEVYPIVSNYTYFFDPPHYDHVVQLGLLSAVIGGSIGYPKQLLSVASGRAPADNESGFVMNMNVGAPYYVNETAQVRIANLNFTAIEKGISNYAPLLGENLAVLWGSSFVQRELGSPLFQETFGKGVNFVIVKSTSIQDVRGVASAIKQILSAHPAYVISYDRATVDYLLSLETGMTPLYDSTGLVSAVFTVIAVLGISYVAVLKRAWEPALLLSQGWSSNEVRHYYFFYFLIVSLLSLGLSILASLVITKYSGVTYGVYGGKINVPVAPHAEIIAIAAVMSILLPWITSSFIIWRIRRRSLDTVFREF